MAPTDPICQIYNARHGGGVENPELRFTVRDPHVEILRYRLEITGNIIYDQPPPVDIDYDEFSGHLENGILTCNMKDHYAYIETARKVVDRYLLGWEIDAALNLGRGAIRFIKIPVEYRSALLGG